MKKNFILLILFKQFQIISSEREFPAEKILQSHPRMYIQVPKRAVPTPSISVSPKEENTKQEETSQLPEIVPKPPPRAKKAKAPPLIIIQPQSKKKDYINPFKKKEGLLPSIVQKSGRRNAIVTIETKDVASFE